MLSMNFSPPLILPGSTCVKPSATTSWRIPSGRTAPPLPGRH
uniref:Uncharacterized protein n=1 Tax=Anguilla anguilla TaxID=7936 RepID=A0A0E9TAR2_ANGAN